jgi:hypothetical protein
MTVALTAAEMARVAVIKKTVPDYQWAKHIEEDVVAPALERIQKATGQEFNSRFLAYAIIHATS